MNTGIMKLQGSSIRSKLMMYFLVLVFLPISTLGILGPVLYARSIENQTTAHTVQMIGQVSRGIEFHVREMEKSIGFLELDPEVRQFFRLDGAGESGNSSGPGGWQDPFPESSAFRLRHDLKNLRESRPEIAGILLVDRQDRPFSNDLERITRDPLTSEAWYQDAALHPGTVRLFSRPIGRNIRSLKGYSDDEIVSVVKAILDSTGTAIAGVVLIDLRVSVIARVFQDSNLGQAGFLFVSDAQGGTVYAPRNEVIYRIPPQAISSTDRAFSLSLPAHPGGGKAGDQDQSSVLGSAHRDFRILSQRSDYTGWYTTAAISLDETLKEIVSMRVYALLIGGVTLALAVIAAFFFTSSVARPVIRLEHLMKRAEEGDLEARWSDRGNDEISRLGRSFNAMLEEIQKLIAQVYQDQMMQREAELRILQEQIKPHFLYNTLDTIQWMARDHKAMDIVGVVEALTTLFRIGLNRGREMIPLSRELDHARSYLLIQKARYEDKFDWQIDFEPGLENCWVVKLILQPLVENAIYHGIKERRGSGRLWIRAWKEEDSLCLLVKDDGAGISLERRQDMNRRLAEGINRREDTGYGMFNVNERIKLRFGPPYGVRFVEDGEDGCTVLIRHPLVEVE